MTGSERESHFASRENGIFAYMYHILPYMDGMGFIIFYHPRMKKINTVDGINPVSTS